MPKTRRQIEKELNKLEPQNALQEEVGHLVDRLDESAEMMHEHHQDVVAGLATVAAAVQDIEIPEVQIPEVKFPDVQRVEVINLKEQKPPIVNVPAPIVNVEAPLVNIEPPIVNVPEAVVNVTVPEPKVNVTVEQNEVNFPDVQRVEVVNEVTIKNLGDISFPIPYGATGGGSNITSISGQVDTELPAAVAAADGMSNPTAPQVLAHIMSYDSVNTNWDRSEAYELVDADTGAGTVKVPPVNLVQRASGGPVEIGISTNPLYADQTTNQATAEASAMSRSGASTPIVYGLGWLYNQTGGSNTWNRHEGVTDPVNRAGGAANTGFTFPVTYAALVGNIMQFDDTSTDTVAEGRMHYPRITSYRAQHTNNRDSSGNELLESTEATLLASAARTTTQTGADITNYSGFKFLHITLDMTTVGTGSVTLEVQGKDVASGKYYAILTGAAVTTNSTNVYKVGPGLPVTANVSVSDVLPRVWRVVITANNANSATYSVGYSLIK